MPIAVFMIRKAANRAPGADLAVELVPPGSDVEEKFSMALKEVEKRKYLPTEVVAKVQAEGFDRFTMDSHTRLWQRLGAKDPAKGYGHCRRQAVVLVRPVDQSGVGRMPTESR